jgi:hypothetical protein
MLKKTEEMVNAGIIIGALILSLLFKYVFFAEDTSLLQWASFFILSTYLSTNLFIKFIMMADELPRGIALGMTRKKMFVYMRCFDLLELLIISVFAIITLHTYGVGLILKVAALVYGLFTLLGGIVGHNTVRYGKVAYLIYYVVMFLFMIGLPRLMHLFSGLADNMALAKDYIVNPVYNQGMIWGIIIAFLAVSMFINWLTMRKIAVSNVY